MSSHKSVSAESVAGYIARLSPQVREEVEALRCAILESVDGIKEEIKWNAPSFCTSEHFATMRVNGKVPLQLILHLGVKKNSIARDSIKDPENLLHWLGPDRACINFQSPGSVAAQTAAIQHIIHQWVRHLPVRVESPRVS